MRKLISTGSPFEEKIGYSRAVVQGDWCFVSGVTGYDYETMEMPKSPAQQAKNCFQTIINVLSEAGFDLSDTARVQYTVTNRTYMDDLSTVSGKYFADIRPAATMVIADLIKDEMLVEVEITAFKG